MMTHIVFFQGVMASKYQLLRYKGLFGDPERRQVVMPQEDLPEVVHWPEYLLNPFYLASVAFAKLKLYLVGQGAYTPAHAIRVWRLNIGQSEDIEAQQNRLSEAPAEAPLIAFGVSRGAMTTFLATTRNSQKNKNVKLVVLEGCPDSISNIIDRRFGASFAAPVANFILKCCTRYNPNIGKHESALALAAKFPHSVPVAFITSERDQTVPAEHTLALVGAVRRAGHPNVYLLVLKDASHDNYFDGSERDRAAYKQFIEELCEKYRI